MKMTVRPSALQLAQVVEQLVDLLRHQHGGRLVEDQDPGAAVEHLEDLDALPVADAERLDQRVGVDRRGRRRRQISSIARRAALTSSRSPRGRLGAEHDVLQHGEVVGQHEVLVHHADAGRDRVGRASGRRPGSPSIGDRALVRLLHAVEDLHQGRLAGAVLADDARARCRGATVMSMSWLATTPGKRLVIPVSSTAVRRSASARVSASGSAYVRTGARWRHASVHGIGSRRDRADAT